jgi:hypothetical protein
LILYTTAQQLLFCKTNLIETVNGKTILLPAWFTKWERFVEVLKIKWRWENSILQRQLKDAAFF